MLDIEKQVADLYDAPLKSAMHSMLQWNADKSLPAELRSPIETLRDRLGNKITALQGAAFGSEDEFFQVVGIFKAEIAKPVEDFSAALSGATIPEKTRDNMNAALTTVKHLQRKLDAVMRVAPASHRSTDGGPTR